jgi:hypothetical protein
LDNRATAEELEQQGYGGGAWTAGPRRRGWVSRTTAEELRQQSHGGGAWTAGPPRRSLDSRAIAEELGQQGHEESRFCRTACRIAIAGNEESLMALKGNRRK